MPRGPKPKTRTSTPSKNYTRRKTYVKKPRILVNKYPDFAILPGSPKLRTHKQLLAAWTPKRKARLKARLEYHCQRALFKNCIYEVIQTEDLINRYMFFQNKCVYCQRPGQRLHMDHYQPLSKGGSHTLLNLLPSCSQCNMAKGACDPTSWYKNHPCFSMDNFIKIKFALKTSLPYIPALPTPRTRPKIEQS